MPHRRIRRSGVAVAVAAVATACSMTVAVASPPTPLITKIDDQARAQVAEGGTVKAAPGTDLVSSMYTLAPGSGTGWRAEPGTSMLAVAKGTLRLHTAKGCTTKEYKAGQAAIVPAGRYLIDNAGSEPLEFAGVFLNLASSAAKPLLDGSAAGSVPAVCTGEYTAASTSGAAATESVRGTVVPVAAYGHSLHATGAAHGFTVEADKDMMVSSYQVQPGFSTGWVTHVPALAILTRGTLTYYEAGDGKCVVSEKYGPGQAYVHVGGFHMATNEGTEAVELTVVYFNLPHGGAGAVIPVVGNTLDGYDFTGLPPTDCPRLR